MRPAMTSSEIKLLEASLRSSDHYVEFGSGGSTALASALVGQSVICVDSSTDWLARVSKECTTIKPTTVYADIGPVGEWGRPIGESRRADWPRYHEYIWEKYPSASRADTYLVDGRFRVACFLQIILRCADHCLLLMHDYHREQYHVVKQFAEEITVVDNLALFRKKFRSFDRNNALLCLEQHRFQQS